MGRNRASPWLECFAEVGAAERFIGTTLRFLEQVFVKVVKLASTFAIEVVVVSDVRPTPALHGRLQAESMRYPRSSRCDRYAFLCVICGVGMATVRGASGRHPKYPRRFYAAFRISKRAKLFGVEDSTWLPVTIRNAPLWWESAGCTNAAQRKKHILWSEIPRKFRLHPFGFVFYRETQRTPIPFCGYPV